MCKELFELCDLQLKSTLEDIKESINSTVSSANQALTLCDLLEEKPEHAAELKNELLNIVTQLQFHDELDQRISHLREVFRFMQTELAENIPRDYSKNGEILEDIVNIFSIKAEFEQLEKIFPEYKSRSISDSVELF